MTTLLARPVEHARGVFAAAISIWTRLLRRWTTSRKRSNRSTRRHLRQAALPVYLPPPLLPAAHGIGFLPPQASPCAPPTQLQSLDLALRMGRGFGSVRTSILVAALEQLRIAEAEGVLTRDTAELRTMIERQLIRRGHARPVDDRPIVPAQR